jgi:hypothetical protein
LNFGSVAVGQSSATLTFINSGGSNLIISATTLSGNSQWGPTTPTTCVLGSSIAPGSTCTAAISFAPQTAGALTRTLTLTDNATNSPQVISLAGTGSSASPAPSPGLRPFLGLSFQGLSLNIGARTYSWGGWTDIVGTDQVYDNSVPRYPTGLWGGTAPTIDSIQMLYKIPSDQTRQIVTDNSVPAGVSNKVLKMTFVNPYVSPTQDNHQIFPDLSQPQGMVYFSKWMWLQPDLPSRGPFWFELHETKTLDSTGPERFGVTLLLYHWTNNQVIWRVNHDGWINGAYTQYAEADLSPSSFYGPMVPGQTNYAPVPLGQWFHVESAWNRSMNGTGWIWVAINGVQVFAQSGAFNFKWKGVTHTVGWNKVLNDPIDRVFGFGAYSNLVRSPINPYSIEQTNIEVWTTWPSTANPHPANFR